MSVTETQMRHNMNRMYRWTRHVYDASRKYYLLGRDICIERLKPQTGDTVCEIGCGTARNLIKLSQKYPKAQFFGIDASDEMLKTATQSIEKKGLSEQIHIHQGYAQSFDPQGLFGLEAPLDKIVFSYSLSIIPPWRESLDHALHLLPAGGEIHIIDFGPMANMPSYARAFIFWWLRIFHVFYKPEIEQYLQRLEYEKRGLLNLKYLFNGYCYHAVFKKF